MERCTLSHLFLWLAPLQLSLAIIGWTLPSTAQAAPTVSISDVAVNEADGGVGVATFTVSLSESFANAVIVNFATGDDPTGSFRATSGAGGCSPGEDFLGLVSAVTLQGNTNAPPSAQITIPTCGDTLDEFDETFVVNLTQVTGGLQIADSQARATIMDDDPLPSLRIGNRAVTEGDAPGAPVNASFTVSLSSVSGKDVTIPSFVTQNGTALGGTGCNGTPNIDYVTTTGALTILRGAPSATINVPVCGDVFDEANETFTIRLSTTADNATVADGTALGTVLDNDPLPTLTVSDASAQEDRFVLQFLTVNGIVSSTPTLKLVNGSIPFVVSLAAPSGRNVPFTYSTISGSANGADACSVGDFIDFERRIARNDSIPAGSLTKTVSITTCRNLIQEPNETLFLNVTSATNAVIADSTATGVIMNNDTITGSFSIDPPEATGAANETLGYTFTWVVPEPQAWRALRTLDLRIRDDHETILWVRWDEASNTFSLFNESTRRFGPAFEAGSNSHLATSAAKLILANTSVIPGGPTAPNVTLNLAISFKPRAAGRTYVVEVAATDDLSNQEDFKQAGTLTVDWKQQKK